MRRTLLIFAVCAGIVGIVNPANAQDTAVSAVENATFTIWAVEKCGAEWQPGAEDIMRNVLGLAETALGTERTKAIAATVLLDLMNGQYSCFSIKQHYSALIR